jgi:hypothetical protein
MPGVLPEANNEVAARTFGTPVKDSRPRSSGWKTRPERRPFERAMPARATGIRRFGSLI